MGLKFQLASAENNQDLINFYKTFQLDAELKFSIERKKNFFQFYESSSSYHETYYIENTETEEIKGLVSFQLKTTEMGQKLVNYTWVTDMRILPERDVIIFWAKNFMNLLSDFNQRNRSKYTLTVVTNYDRKLYNSLIHPKSPRKNLPRYELISNFDWVNIHGTVPLHRLYLHGISVQRMQGDELDELCTYLQKKTQNSLLHPRFSPETLTKDIQKVPGFDLGNFFIARDSKENIIGCLGFIRNHYCQNFWVHSYAGPSENLKNITRWLSPFGFIKALPKPGEEAKFIYLRYLYADNSDILQMLMLKVLKDSDKNEFLAYPHFYHDTITNPPSSFLHSTLKLGLYALVDPDKGVPQELRISPFSPSPYIDIAFI